jgi:hypothetical protein
MNNAGVIMGVDTLRSAQATSDTPGINALLLVRSTIHNSASTEDALEYIGNAKRGCPYLVKSASSSQLSRVHVKGFLTLFWIGSSFFGTHSTLSATATVCVPSLRQQRTMPAR